jgi:hypothetical protein
VNLSGWQLIAALTVGAAMGVTGAVMHAPELVTLGGTVLGGVLGLMQPFRGQHPRTRATDEREGDR